MAWDSRVLSVVRAWGLGVALLVALSLGGAALLAGDVYVDLPGVPDIVAVLHLFPGLVAMALAFPLVDRTPEWTLLSARGPVPLLLGRLAGVLALATLVAACVRAAGWSVAGTGVVLGFVGVAALASAVLGLWYWAPVLGLTYGWVQWPARDEAVRAGPAWAALWLVVLLAGGAGYVLVEASRVRRQVGGAGSGARCRADTIRP